MASRLPFVFTLLAALLWLAACGGGSSSASAQPGGMPPAEVGVVTVAMGDVGLVTELPGRLEPSRVAQVRARAAGIVQQRLFREGSDVRAGQVLYRIDSGTYQAAQASAQAQVARAEANLGQATALANRYKPLAEANAISKQDLINAQAAQKQAEADVAAARAGVRVADINLGYASVVAPISGRIGRSLVTEGALVGQGEATPLAIIQQVDPLFVNFTQSAGEVLALRRALADGRLKRAGGEEARVHVVLEDGTQHPQPGKLLFADLTVDASTGQVTVRAEVPNKGGLLLPGMYVRVRLEQARAGNAILLPQQAVTRSPQGDTVMVVAADGKVATRPVKISGSQGTNWVVLSGLQAGEQVVVDGFQKMRPGALVKAVPWSATPAAGAAPAGPKVADPAASGAKR